MSSIPALKADNLLIKGIRGPILQGLSFEVERGSVLGIVSTNRLAVRSLILAIAGFLPWGAGSLEYLFPGRPAGEKGPRDVAHFISGLTLPPKLLVKEVFALQGRRRSADSAVITEVSSLLALDGISELRLERLPGVARSRAQLAACLAGDEDCVVLDYLPPEIGRAQLGLVRNYLSSMANLGRTILTATDEPEDFCDKVLLIKGPSAFEFGDTEALRRRLAGPGRVELAVRGLTLPSVEEQLMRLGSSWIYTEDDRLMISCANERPRVEELISVVTSNRGVVEGVRTVAPRLLDAAGWTP